MTDILEKIDNAVAAFKCGNFSGNIVSLLEKAKSEITAKREEEKIASFDNTREVYETYRFFHKKLEEIGRLFVAARIPNAESVYLMKWHYHDGKNNNNETLALDLEYRRHETEGDEDPNNPDGYDGFGRGFVSRNMYVYINPEWLWTEDYHDAVKIAGIQHELELAEKRQSDLSEALPKREQDLIDLRARLDSTADHARKLRSQLTELSGGQ